jgi:formate hydrogenlyase subunit 3/multisubunit Na+/H+ antiporter MnhD subunit
LHALFNSFGKIALFFMASDINRDLQTREINSVHGLMQRCRGVGLWHKTIANNWIIRFLILATLAGQQIVLNSLYLSAPGVKPRDESMNPNVLKTA